MRILILANNPDFCVAQPYLLLSPGDEIALAAPDRASLAEIRRQRPDLVLIDENLPECDGYQLANQVHDDLETREIPVMVVPGLERHVPSETNPQLPEDVQQVFPGYAPNADEALVQHWQAGQASLERQILEYMDQAVIVTRLDGSIIYWNRHAQDLYSLDPNTVMGRRSEDVLGKRGKDFRQKLETRLEVDGVWSMEYLIRHPDGRMIPIQLNLNPLRDELGRIIGVIESSIDISERKEDESRYQRALFNAPFPVILHAEDGEIIMINREWTEISGYEPGHIPRMQDWLEKAYPDRQMVVQTLVDSLYKTDERVVHAGEYEITTIWGTRRTWDFSSTPLGKTRDGRRIFMSMAVDLTDRKEAENQLRRAIDDAPFPIMIHTGGGKIALLNRAWTDLTGYDITDLPTVAEWIKRAYGGRLPAGLEDLHTYYTDQKRRSYTFDYEIQTKDGRRRVWNFSTAPLGQNTIGEPLVMAIAADVTDRHLIERRFERSIIDAPFPIVMYAEDGEMLMVSREWTEQTGYALEDIPELNIWMQKAYGEHWQENYARISRAFPFDESIHLGLFTVRTAWGGQRIWDIHTASPGRLPDGRRIRLSMAADVTELRQTQKQFELAVLGAPYPIAMYAEDGDVLLVNHAWTELSGYSAADIPRIQDWFQHIHHQDRLKLERALDLASDDEKRREAGEYSILTASGEQRVWQISGVNLGQLPDGRLYHLMMATDVTARKQEEKRFQTAVDNAPFPIMIHAEDGQVLYINQTLTSLTGYRLEDVPTLADWIAKAYPDRMMDAAETLKRGYASHGTLHGGEFNVTTVSGRVLIWDWTNVELIPLPDGRRTRMSMATDVTERKHAEQQFQLAVDYAPFPMMIHAEDGQVLRINKAWTDITGYTQEDLPTMEAHCALCFPDNAAQVLETVKQSYLRGGSFHGGEYVLRIKNGRTRIWDFSSVELGRLLDGRRTRLAMASDVTERKEAEARFRQASDF